MSLVGEREPELTDLQMDERAPEPEKDAAALSALNSLQARQNDRESVLLAQLKAKAEKESEEKRRRQAAAKKQLDEFMRNRQAEVAKAKAEKQRSKEAIEGAGATKSHAESWGVIVNNIALKEGDYPGTKSVVRMKNVILNQYNFLKDNKGA